jgi:hypothetical protein
MKKLFLLSLCVALSTTACKRIECCKVGFTVSPNKVYVGFTSSVPPVSSVAKAAVASSYNWTAHYNRNLITLSQDAGEGGVSFVSVGYTADFMENFDKAAFPYIAAAGGYLIDRVAFVSSMGREYLEVYYKTGILMVQKTFWDGGGVLFFDHAGINRKDIVSLSFSDVLPTGAEGVDLFDVSLAGDKSVMAKVEDHSGDLTVIIGAEGGVRANSNSQALLSQLTKINYLDIRHLDIYGISDMTEMFLLTTLPAGFSLPANFGREASSMKGMFSFGNLSELPALPEGFGSAATNMTDMFRNTLLPNNGSFALPAGFGEKANDISGLFRTSTFQGDIYWAKTSLNPVTKLDVFMFTAWNGYKLHVATPEMKTAIDASEANVVVP